MVAPNARWLDTEGVYERLLPTLHSFPMSWSSGTVYNCGNADYYGESSARSNEHDAEVRQVGFDLSEAPQEPQPPNTTVEAGEVGDPGPSGPKVTPLADLTSAFNEEPQTKQNTKKKNVVASQHDVEVPTSTTPPRAFFASAALPDMPSAPFTGTGEPT